MLRFGEICKYPTYRHSDRAVGLTGDIEIAQNNNKYILFIFYLILIVSNSFSNIIRSEGHATVAMTGMIIGNMINIVLDPVMIIGFNGMLQVQLLPQFLVTFSQPYFILSTLLPSGRYYRLNLKIIPLKR